MEILDFGHNALLVAMSFFMALVAGFTGLSLTRNLSSKSLPRRKASVALASVALGGGIWSMHFVAMLGLQLPILYYYDAAITLASALIAILMVAVALGLLHLVERSSRIITLAGAIVGAGILVMHYVGMAGLQLCRAIYSPMGVGLSSISAVALCVLAFRIAYQTRNNRNIVIGTLCFGVAVFTVHFLAMAGTSFVAVDQFSEFGPTISNEALAVSVILSSFAIFSTFLWVSSAFLAPEPDQTGDVAPQQVTIPEVSAEPPNDTLFSVPCERDGNRIQVLVKDIAFVRADGHYTQIYTDTDRSFCAWPVTEAAKRLAPYDFMQVHRSYLINPRKVARFERGKDNGKCFFRAKELPPAPVSRSKMKDVELMLAPLLGAIGAT
jgi:diguanylate cyclase